MQLRRILFIFIEHNKIKFWNPILKYSIAFSHLLCKTIYEKALVYICNYSIIETQGGIMLCTLMAMS